MRAATTYPASVPDTWHAPKDWLRGALCVHSKEAAWDNPGRTWDGKPSRYYGGMQFDLKTWGSVGGQGWPYKATPREQIYRAYLLWQEYGWYPWPNTAAECGLL